jgi:cytochrome c biogenesis protein CcdA
MKKTFFLFNFLLLMLFINVAYPTEKVVIEFLYYDPTPDWIKCPACFQDAYDDFLVNNATMNRIQNDYSGQVLVNWTEYYSDYGQRMRDFYKITQPNSLIIRDERDNFTVIGVTWKERTFNETYIEKVIDAYLGNTPLPSPPLPPSLMAVLPLAFSFGFLETFSPCLLALLSFVLSFSIGETTKSREGFFHVMAFGVGFLFAALVLGLTFGLVFLSMLGLRVVLLWVVCVFAIFFGLNLLGINILKFLNGKFDTKPLVRKLTKKYVFTYAGLILLGFVFYFLDPCIAPIFVSMVPLMLLNYLPLILFIFSLGLMLPFIIIGMLTSSISKLVRVTYRHKSIIRAVSGLILITYALYLIVVYLIF